MWSNILSRAQWSTVDGLSLAEQCRQSLKSTCHPAMVHPPAYQRQVNSGALGLTLQFPALSVLSTRCRLQIGDTVECNSALRAFGVTTRRPGCEIFWLAAGT